MSDLTDRLRCFDRQTCTEAAERIETLEAELAAMRAGGKKVEALRHALRSQQLAPSAAPEEPLQAFDSPRAKSLMRAWEEGWEACRDAEYVGEEAQNDAFNSSHTLTLCLAEDQLLPTPQADSQPAPLREGEWINDAGRIKWLMWRVQDLEAKLAARAPADSVLEDAARLERERICAAIKAEDDYCVEHGDYMLDSDDCIKIARSEWVRPDYLVDAARKQGANHD